MKIWRSSLMAMVGLAVVLGLSGFQAQAARKPETYTAKLTPLNSNVSGSKAHGIVRFRIFGNTLTITLRAEGLPPGMMHMAHLHGFISGKNATCPTSAADTNHDGVIDLNETEAASGVTLVPLNNDPAALKIASDTYPHADKQGRAGYTKIVSLSALDANMAKTYQGASLDLANRVVYIHGVPADAKVPKTAASLPGVPAAVTLPIACGKIMLVR